VLRRRAGGGTASQSRLGGGTNGVADWMDSTRWPALPGYPQYAWEPARATQEKSRSRRPRLEALGDAMVPQQIAPFLQFIVEQEQAYACSAGE
jgi:hypothetical protein